MGWRLGSGVGGVAWWAAQVGTAGGRADGMAEEGRAFAGWAAWAGWLAGQLHFCVLQCMWWHHCRGCSACLLSTAGSSAPCRGGACPLAHRRVPECTRLPHSPLLPWPDPPSTLLHPRLPPCPPCRRWCAPPCPSPLSLRLPGWCSTSRGGEWGSSWWCGGGGPGVWVGVSGGTRCWRCSWRRHTGGHARPSAFCAHPPSCFARPLAHLPAPRAPSCPPARPSLLPPACSIIRESAWQLELKGDVTRQRRLEAVDKLMSVLTLVVAAVLGVQALGLDVNSGGCRKGDGGRGGELGG